MMEKVKIFIASSLEDLKSERSSLVNFIYETNNQIRDKYNIELIPVYCEAEDHRYSLERMQDTFNSQLANSDIAIFMFYHDAGDYTRLTI